VSVQAQSIYSKLLPATVIEDDALPVQSPSKQSLYFTTAEALSVFVSLYNWQTCTGVAEGDGVLLTETEGVLVADIDIEVVTDGVTDILGVTDIDGVTDILGVTDTEGVTDTSDVTDIDGVIDIDGVTDAVLDTDIDGVLDTEIEGVTDGVTDILGVLETDKEGVTDADGVLDTVTEGVGDAQVYNPVISTAPKSPDH
jgi:hypothetical protein